MTLDLPIERFTTVNPVTATEDISIDEVRELMAQHAMRHLPIERDGKVVGIVSDRDVRVVLGLSSEHQLQVCAGDIMASGPVSLPATTSLARAASVMTERRIGSIIVNRADGGLLGIFTVTDALKALIEISR